MTDIKDKIIHAPNVTKLIRLNSEMFPLFKIYLGEFKPPIAALCEDLFESGNVYDVLGNLPELEEVIEKANMPGSTHLLFIARYQSGKITGVTQKMFETINTAMDAKHAKLTAKQVSYRKGLGVTVALMYLSEYVKHPKPALASITISVANGLKYLSNSEIKNPLLVCETSLFLVFGAVPATPIPTCKMHAYVNDFKKNINTSL